MREHGTRACYVWGPESGDKGAGCRCDLCRRAVAEYEAERKRRIEPPYVGAAEVRAHLAFLAENGIGLKTVAKRSGVSHGALTKIVYGSPQRAPSKRVRPATRDAILAVTPADAADGAKVPATQVWKDVEALLARGWTKAAISRTIGQNGLSLQLGKEQVRAERARAVHTLLDQPVPNRRSRHGEHPPVPQPDVEPEEESVETMAYDERERAVLDLAIILEQRLDARSWRRRAQCTRPDIPARMFFTTRGDHRAVEAARKVCQSCPVQAECLEEALALPSHDDIGIKAGTSGQERRRMRAEREQVSA